MTAVASVSVVIPTRDRPNELTRCLASLADLVGVKPEVVVVDTSARPSAARDIASSVGARYLEVPNGGLESGANSGC